MSLPLLQTKFHVPFRRQQGVARPAITAKLQAGLVQPLTLVAAPAGFGKTTAVSEWITQVRITSCELRKGSLDEQTLVTRNSELVNPQVAWLSLDEDDNDTTRFLTYLIAALQTRHPPIGGSAQAQLDTPQVPPAKAILTLLLNDLSALTAPLILVLDDYHLLTTPAIHEALAFLIDHLPPMFHLVITSRIDPPLPLARWRARNQLTEIRADVASRTQAIARGRELGLLTD